MTAYPLRDVRGGRIGRVLQVPQFILSDLVPSPPAKRDTASDLILYGPADVHAVEELLHLPGVCNHAHGS